MTFIAIVIVVAFIIGLISWANKKQNQVVKIEESVPQVPPTQEEITEDRISVGEISFQKSTTNIPYYIIVDVETTGLPKDRQAHPSVISNWPKIVQIAWLVLDKEMGLIEYENHYSEDCRPIPPSATKIHGITDEFIFENGDSIKTILRRFLSDLEQVEFVVAHNIEFDIPVIESEIYRSNLNYRIIDKRLLCTMVNGARYANGYGNRISLLNLSNHVLKGAVLRCTPIVGQVA